MVTSFTPPLYGLKNQQRWSCGLNGLPGVRVWKPGPPGWDGGHRASTEGIWLKGSLGEEPYTCWTVSLGGKDR